MVEDGEEAGPRGRREHPLCNQLSHRAGESGNGRSVGWILGFAHDLGGSLELIFFYRIREQRFIFFIQPRLFRRHVQAAP